MLKKFLKTSDNNTIAINHYFSGRQSVLIICPGWYMTKDSQCFRAMAEDFYRNTDVIIMDFRGHGESSGFYTFSARETLDLKTVVDYAKKKYTHVNLMGFSLGGAVSIIYTAKYKNIDSLICISAPADFDKIENHFFKKEAFLPTMQKFELTRSLSIRPGNMFLNKIKPIDIVQDISPVPALFIAGGKDPTVYPWHTQALFERTQHIKKFELFENDFHAEDLYLNSRDKFLQVCSNWISQLAILAEK